MTARALLLLSFVVVGISCTRSERLMLEDTKIEKDCGVAVSFNDGRNHPYRFSREQAAALGKDGGAPR